MNDLNGMHLTTDRLLRVWGLRGITVWCSLCCCDTTHNAAAHQAGMAEQEPS